VAAVCAAPAASKPKPPKPKPPKVTLLTGTEQGALRHKAIKVMVESQHGKDVRVKAQFVVDGYPEDFVFALGPEDGKLRGGSTKVKFGLSARQREVLDFAAQTCRGASLAISAKAAGRTGQGSGSLALPSDCAATGRR
jgi:hypothetical protein